MKTIYHFFKAKTLHHVPKYIRNFRYLHEKNGGQVRFVLFNYNNKFDHVYDKIEAEEQLELIKLRTKWQILRFFLIHHMNRQSIFVLHGFNQPYFIFNFLIPLKRSKTYWVCWGDGINSHKGLKGVLYDVIKKLLYSKIDSINTLMSPDKDDLINKFNYKGNITTIPYFNKAVQIDPNKTRRYFEDANINILVGNNVATYNNHFEWFEQLEKFKGEPIRVIVFAGYGVASEEYIERVRAYGERLFGDKFVFITSLLDIETFNSVMKSVDILIVDVLFQNGLGTINTNIFYGGNVYLKAGSSNEAWMRKRGIVSFSLDAIRQARDVKELLRLTEKEKKNNFEVILAHRNSVPEYEKRWCNFLYS